MCIRDSLDAYWGQRAEASAEAAPEREGACLDGQPGRTSWANGDVLCYVNESGYAQLRWTDERSATYGVMNAVPDEVRIKVLARQWRTIVAS